VSLITGLENGLENGLEQWNGLDNTAEAPFHPVLYIFNQFPTLSGLRRVSFVAVKATSYDRTHQLLNMHVIFDPYNL